MQGIEQEQNIQNLNARLKLGHKISIFLDYLALTILIHLKSKLHAIQCIMRYFKT